MLVENMTLKVKLNWNQEKNCYIIHSNDGFYHNYYKASR